MSSSKHWQLMDEDVCVEVTGEVSDKMLDSVIFFQI
jgi:hypothetical protein